MDDLRQRHRVTVDDRVGSASNVLLLGPSLDDGTAASCSALLGAPDRPDAVVFVNLARAPDTQLRAWAEGFEHEPPERVGVVTVGDPPTASDRQARLPVPGGPAPARVVSAGRSVEPTALWTAIARLLDDWPDGRTALCFDSLTVLLQYIGTRRIFRFCHALVQRIATADDTAHYHLDPGAVGDRTVRTLAQVFDTVVEPRDGELHVHGR